MSKRTYRKTSIQIEFAEEVLFLLLLLLFSFVVIVINVHSVNGEMLSADQQIDV